MTRTAPMPLPFLLDTVYGFWRSWYVASAEEILSWCLDVFDPFGLLEPAPALASVRTLREVAPL